MVTERGKKLSVTTQVDENKFSFVFKKTIMNISTDVNSRIEGLNSLLSSLTLVLLGSGFLLCLVIVGVMANITVCIVMVRGRRFKKHLSNFMLFHLSITDIVYRLIVVPGQYAAILYPIENKPTMLCKVAKTFLYTVYTAVFTSLVIIAFDRHQCITKPFQRLRHKPKFYRYVLAVWGYSVVCALPQMFNGGIGTYALNYTIPFKGDNFSNFTQRTWLLCSSSNEGSSQRIVTTIYFILGFFVPLVIITVAYSKIAVFLWRRSRNGMVNQTALKSKGKALRMLVWIVLGFVVCFGAPQLKDLMESFGFKDQLVFSILAFSLRLSSSLINPIIYGFYSAEFKQGLKNLR